MSNETAYIYYAQEAVGTGEDLVVIHLGGDMTGILIVGNGEGDGHPLTAGGQVMIAIGGIGNGPSFNVASLQD